MLHIVPHTVPRVGRSYEHFPDGFELHLLPSLGRGCALPPRRSLALSLPRSLALSLSRSLSRALSLVRALSLARSLALLRSLSRSRSLSLALSLALRAKGYGVRRPRISGDNVTNFQYDLKTSIHLRIKSVPCSLLSGLALSCLSSWSHFLEEPRGNGAGGP